MKGISLYSFNTRLKCLLLIISQPFISMSQNAIVIENGLAGNPISEWGVPNFRDTLINGYATEISVNKGQTVQFKINVFGAANFSVTIYRLGYYNGNGARLISNLGSFTGTIQPSPITDAVTGLVDCSNWSQSVSWSVPSTAVSGLYIAKLTRVGGGSNHIVFVVRDDGGNADILFQTTDATWQAYNGYGHNYFYQGGTGFPNGHAVKVSYNRPIFPYNAGFLTDNRQSDWYMNAEYPMIRWLERNGYNISYTTCVETARHGSRLLNHKIFLVSGHDEYWSKEQRDSVEIARNAGVNMAFFTGNEVYWKTRWENDVNGNDHHILVCYKEGKLGDGSTGEATCGYKCDPLPTIWTGLWRTGGDFDGGRPENALTGQISWSESNNPIQVPYDYKNLRFWRNTNVASLAPGETANLADNTLGYEWDPDQYPDSYPNGRIKLSETLIGGNTHNLSLYRHSSGALVFGAGTVQWSWGLDDQHFGGTGNAISADMQQATVNLFADMNVQPGSLQLDLVTASASTDFTPPATAITYPFNGVTIPNATVIISGTASEANVIAGIEVSVDGGLTWKLANGTGNWTFSWTPTAPGPVIIKSRGYDDSGNMEGNSVSNQISITVSNEPAACPCTIFTGQTPITSLMNDGQPIELGVKFRSSVTGYVTGIRFYKTNGNSGTHTGELYASAGTLLARAVFTGETVSGWQEVLFNTPVAIMAGTTYIAAYHSSSGYYTGSNNYFTNAIVHNPLTALANGTDGPNGVYVESGTPAFPTSSNPQTNYWVDLVFHNLTNTWKGMASTAWENPANWSWGIVPNTNTDVIISAGNPYNPTISSNVTIKSLTMNTSGLLTVANGFKLTIKIP